MTPDVAEAVADAEMARRMCRYPDAPHTCYYLCEANGCSARVDSVGDDDTILCGAHRGT